MKYLSLFIILMISTAFTGPIEDLQPGHWLAVPNSHLRDAEKKPNEYPDWNGTSSAYYDAMQAKGVKAIINNWCGGDYDSTANRMLIWGGGHWGYGGNEVYAFDVPTLKWIRLSDPSFPVQECVKIYSDGQPSARHTYGSIAVIEHARHMLGMGASTFCRTGGSGNDILWTYDFGDNTWTNMNPNGIEVKTWVEDKCTYWPEDGKVYYHSPGTGRRGLYTYDFDSNTWTNVTRIGWPESGNCGGMSQTIDSKRRLIVEVGKETTSIIMICDMDTVSGGFTTVSTSGDIAPTGWENPGLAYDPVSDRVVAWYYSNDIYVLDMDSLKWTKITSANSVPMPNAKINSGGVYGRFRYMPDYNAFIAVMHVDSPVYIYKLPEDLSGMDTKHYNKKLPEISVQPNPFSSSVNIRVQRTQNTGDRRQNTKVKIFNIKGELVTILSPEFCVLHSGITWNTSNHPPGLYVIRLNLGKKQFSKRIHLLK